MTASKQIYLKRATLFKEFVPRLAFGMFIMLLTVLLQLAFPKLIAYFIDNVQLKQTFTWYINLGLILIAVLLFQAFTTSLRYYLFETTGLKMVMKIRRVLHQALVAQNIAFYDKHNIGELTNRLSCDVEMLQESLTMGAALCIRSLLIAIGASLILVSISPLLSLMLLIFIPLSLFMGKWIGDNIRHRSRNIQQHLASCGKIAHEHLANIRLVHSFNSQNKANQAYSAQANQTLGISVECTQFLAIFRGVSSLILYFALLVILALGAKLIHSGSLSIGELTSFILYAAMVTTSAGVISDFWSDWMRALGATERVFEIIDTLPVTDVALASQQNQPHQSFAGNIRFDNVSFSYPERPQEQALNAITFAIETGEKIALIGHSGAGKSTIASLLLGFYPTQSGRIVIDNQGLDDIPPAQLRHNIAIVEQEPALFCCSIFDNIAYAAKEASVEQVIAAAKLANADDFINTFPNGYHTLVGDRGVQLSGGQKQRIAIARALLRDPKILILDEATSALDANSESQVQQALDNLMEGRTTIMIAHRYSTIAKADRVLVLAQGRIIEQGSHLELRRKPNSQYNQLMKHQLTQEKIAQVS
jgi:ATP-binding cassette, subfamily B, bacterial